MPNKNITMFQNDHFKDLVLLLAVPIGVAIFAAVVIYTPRLLANPKYDFIYSACEDYSCINSYSVDTYGYVAESFSSGYDHSYAVLRYYDSANDSTRALTFEETKRYQLDTASKSPDGYIFIRENSSSGFLFWSSHEDGWYLKNGIMKREVNLMGSDSYYSSNNIKFLGWVNQ